MTEQTTKCGAYASEYHRSTADGGCPLPTGHQGAHGLSPRVLAAVGLEPADTPPELTSKHGMLARLRNAMHT